MGFITPLSLINLQLGHFKMHRPVAGLNFSQALHAKHELTSEFGQVQLL
jgi:hypothetical protein